MKTWKIAAGVTLALAVSTAYAGTTPGSGLLSTKHDFTGRATTVYLWKDMTATGSPTTTYNTGTALCGDGTFTAGVASCPTTNAQQTSSIGSIGLCTKCHTPHKAKSTNLLWNHTLLSTNYSWDDPKTTAGTLYPQFQGDTYKGPSTKCLSCHDGTMASTDGMWFNRQFNTSKPYSPSPGQSTLDTGHEIAEGAGAGNMAGNHPVAFPYPLNGVVSTYNGVATGPGLTSGDWIPDPSKTNNITLYNQVGGTAGPIVRGSNGNVTGMECSSCHDVHNGPRALGVMLLTGQLTGNTAASGYICLQCHIK